MRFTILILSVFCAAFVASKNLQNRYDNFKVYRVEIPNAASASIINNDLQGYVDIWAEPRVGRHSDIMVSPTDSIFVEQKLKDSHLEYSVMVENVQNLIDAEKIPATTNDETKVGHPMDWTSYHSQDDMEAYMDYLVEQYPDFVSTEVIGKSYEGRTTRILKICKGGTCGQKPAIWIDGGIHSREWVSPAVATYIMKELLENGGQYPSEIVDELDWYILPVLNPDGYEYSRSSDRMWRKSRYGFEFLIIF
jgi:murein tripeptide amidase MpaA